MYTKKQIFVKDVIKKILSIFTQGKKHKVADSKIDINMKNSLGIVTDELRLIIEFLVNDIPEILFLEKHKEIKDKFANLVSEKLPLFLSRENVDSEYFKNHLENFRTELMSILMNYKLSEKN